MSILVERPVLNNAICEEADGYTVEEGGWLVLYRGKEKIQTYAPATWTSVTLKNVGDVVELKLVGDNDNG